MLAVCRSLSTSTEEEAGVIDEVHDASATGWRPGKSGWSLHRLVDAFAKVCDAVGYAHARGVVHRDLKPENVMVGAHGEVLVLDWGAREGRGPTGPGAAEAGDPSSPTAGDDAIPRRRRASKTRVGGVLDGGLHAPRAGPRRGRPLDARSDVYALGAMLYEILSGRPAVRGARRAGACCGRCWPGRRQPPGRSLRGVPVRR